MEDEDDWPKKQYKAEDMPGDDGRLGRATGLVYALAAVAIVAGVVIAWFASR